MGASGGLLAVRVSDELSCMCSIIGRDEHAHPLGELQFRLLPSGVVRRNSGCDSMGLEQADNELSLECRWRTGDDHGQA